MNKCIVCGDKSKFTINRGTISEVKLCVAHYDNKYTHLQYPYHGVIEWKHINIQTNARTARPNTPKPFSHAANVQLVHGLRWLNEDHQWRRRMGTHHRYRSYESLQWLFNCLVGIGDLMTAKKIAELEKSVKDLQRKLDFFINSHNLHTAGERISHLNERVRFSMQIIADELKVPLYSLFDDKERGNNQWSVISAESQFHFGLIIEKDTTRHNVRKL